MRKRTPPSDYPIQSRMARHKKMVYILLYVRSHTKIRTRDNKDKNNVCRKPEVVFDLGVCMCIFCVHVFVCVCVCGRKSLKTNIRARKRTSLASLTWHHPIVSRIMPAETDPCGSFVETLHKSWTQRQRTPSPFPPKGEHAGMSGVGLRGLHAPKPSAFGRIMP